MYTKRRFILSHIDKLESENAELTRENKRLRLEIEDCEESLVMAQETIDELYEDIQNLY